MPGIDQSTTDCIVDDVRQIQRDVRHFIIFRTLYDVDVHSELLGRNSCRKNIVTDLTIDIERNSINDGLANMQDPAFGWMPSFEASPDHDFRVDPGPRRWWRRAPSSS